MAPACRRQIVLDFEPGSVQARAERSVCDHRIRLCAYLKKAYRRYNHGCVDDLREALMYAGQGSFLEKRNKRQTTRGHRHGRH
jgi:hypothetical protein